MNKISIFDRIFRKQPKPPPNMTRAAVVTGGTAIFTPWSGNAYANDIYREGVDAIARNAGKLKGMHVVQRDGRAQVQSDRINRILQVKPNEVMTAYDLIYKMVTHYYLYNNAFALIDRDERRELRGVYPLLANNAEFVESDTGRLYVRFFFHNGKDYIFPYSDVIHIRRHFNDDEFMGDTNAAIVPALELAHAQNEGMLNAIKNSAHIRGIAHFIGVVGSKALRESRDEFMRDFMEMSNTGGVIATGKDMNYIPIDHKPVLADEAQARATKEKVYNYLGISEKIVNSTYTEDEWAAFYESVVEVIALQLSLEFTNKIFSDREQAFGNQILFESNRLQFSSMKTKIDTISILMPYGLLTVNQALEILNLPPTEDGNRRLQTLNVIDANSARNYQLERNLKREAIKEETGVDTGAKDTTD